MTDHRASLFERGRDYEAFEAILGETLAKTPLRVCGSCLTPNYRVMRYAERNALRANLGPRAEQRRWGSLHRGKSGSAKEKAALAAWPLPRWPGWVAHVNAAQTDAELAAVRRRVQRGSPFGEAP